MEKLVEILWCVVWQEDASETEGKGLQNWSDQLCCMVQWPGQQREDKKHD